MYDLVSAPSFCMANTSAVNIKPTIPGPFDMIDQVVQPDGQRAKQPRAVSLTRTSPLPVPEAGVFYS
jgi:hypothetical protein